MNIMDLPRRSLKPKQFATVTARSDEVCLAVAVDVGRMDVGRAGLVVGEKVLLPNLHRIRGSFPPSEPVAQTSTLSDPVKDSGAANDTSESDTTVQGRESFGVVDDSELPPLTFGTFMLSRGTQVLVALGLVPNPMTQEIEHDIVGAKQTIDILEILEEKTRGNLDKDEESLMKDLLYDLRMRYVEVSSKGK